jgi:hypothetical protein
MHVWLPFPAAREPSGQGNPPVATAVLQSDTVRACLLPKNWPVGHHRLVRSVDGAELRNRPRSGPEGVEPITQSTRLIDAAGGFLPSN